MSTSLACSLGASEFLEWGVVNSRGAAGGVLVFWDNRVLDLVGMDVGEHLISCHFKNCEDSFVWIFSGFMALPLGVIERVCGQSWGPLRGFGMTRGVSDMILA